MRLSIDEVGVGLSVALLYTDGYWYRGCVTEVLGILFIYKVNKKRFWMISVAFYMKWEIGNQIV